MKPDPIAYLKDARQGIEAISGLAQILEKQPDNAGLGKALTFFAQRLANDLDCAQAEVEELEKGETNA